MPAMNLQMKLNKPWLDLTCLLPQSSKIKDLGFIIGSRILLENVTDQDISIAHRDPHHSINRSVSDGKNGGASFKATTSQTRLGYDSHPEWPLVNIFPPHILVDPTQKISKTEFLEHCGHYTVLPHFYLSESMSFLKQTSEMRRVGKCVSVAQGMNAPKTSVYPRTGMF